MCINSILVLFVQPFLGCEIYFQIRSRFVESLRDSFGILNHLCSFVRLALPQAIAKSYKILTG
jgi:hypothetical protein